MSESQETKKKSIFKKWWFWLIIIVLIIAIAGSQGTNPNSQNIASTNNAEIEEKKPINSDVPKEYQNALKKAESYSELMHMSKQAIYDQLTSEYGEKFTAEEAQYAIDNLE